MIGLVFGGESCEHDISIITALSTYNAIKNKIKITLIYMKNGSFYVGEKLSEINSYKHFSTRGLKKAYFENGEIIVGNGVFRKREKVEAVVMCNHGGAGENGSLSGYFETVGIPYSASNPVGSGICMDKAFAKALLEKFKFPTVNYRIFRECYDVGKLSDIEYPVIIKPARNGSSVGISYAKDKDELIKGIEYALSFDDKLIIEKALQNFREFNCAAFDGENGVVVSDVEEVVSENKFLNFDDKYMSSASAEHKIPADIAYKLRDKIMRITKEIYLLFELKGVVRVDFLYADNKLFVNEINTIPGSMASYLFKSKEVTYPDLIESLIDAAKRSYDSRHKLASDFASDVLKNFDGVKSDGIKK